MALISNMTIDFFKIPAQKYLNKVFLVQKLAILFLHKIWQLDKVDGVDFNYDNSFF